MPRDDFDDWRMRASELDDYVARVEQVAEDEHLAVAVRPGADPDRRDRELPRHGARQLHRDALEDERVAAGALEGSRVVQELLRAIRVPPLHDVAAEPVHGLRREAEVAHHRHARADDPSDDVREVGAALELHRLDAALGDEPDGGAHRVVGARLVAAEREVADGVRAAVAAGEAAPHHRRVVDHLVEGDGERRVVPLHHHPERVADEDGVDARGRDEPRRGRVVRGDHRDRRPGLLHAAQLVDGDVLPLGRRVTGHVPPRFGRGRPSPGAAAPGLRCGSSSGRRRGARSGSRGARSR